MKKIFLLIMIPFVLLSFFACRDNDNNPSDSNENITPDKDVSDNGDKTPEENPEEIDFSNMYYVAFGDSITYGWLNSLKMDSPYPESVEKILGIGSVYNGGIPAGTLANNTVGFPCATDGILASTGEMDIISVMLGVNDYASSVPLGVINDKTKDTIYGSLNLIAEHLTTTQKDAFIFFMTPYKCKLENSTYKDKNEAGYTLEDVVIAIKEVAAKYNIPVLDMFNEGQYELEMYNSDSDGVHPSQEFVKKYTAPQIAEFIKSNYK